MPLAHPLAVSPPPTCAALQALGPRSIPTAAAVEGELRKLRLEEGRGADGGSSDEEEAGTGRYRTALAKEPDDYFGFVG